MDSNGKIMGYIQPNVELDGKETNTARYEFRFTWNNVAPNSIACSNDSHSFVKGDKIHVTVYQNPSGTGNFTYIGLRDNDTGSHGFPKDSATTSGWNNAIITVGYSGHFSFAILNSSSRLISYSGSYWF